MDFTAVLVAEDQNPWERIAAEVLASPAYDSTAARVKAFVQRDSSEALPPTNWRLYNQHRSRSVPVYAIKR